VNIDNERTTTTMRYHITNLALILLAILLFVFASIRLPDPANDYTRNQCAYYYHTTDLTYCSYRLRTDTP
jgi:hypothetical protein